jgi:hypothetical protein
VGGPKLEELRRWVADCDSELGSLPVGRARTRGLLALVAQAMAEARDLAGPRFSRLRLLEGERPAAPGPRVRALAERLAPGDAECLGQLFEVTLASGSRKRSGSYFTPRALAAQVAERALRALAREPAAVCDPAMGGGVFLAAVLRAHPPSARRELLESRLYGVDRDVLAVAVAEAVLWLACEARDLDPAPLRARLVVGDALERGFERRLPGLGPGGFDLVIGNPPWVAFAGRAAEPLAPVERARFKAEYTSFRGYPTLHGLFVERAAELAPAGVVALILPSPLADLDGYRFVRQALGRSHVPCEPLLELGQDAFEGVTQPAFVLVAAPGSGVTDGRPFRLAERSRASVEAAELAVPEVIARLAALPPLPRELFGELGFQSAGDVSKTLFLRAASPDARHTVPLLEGKRVSEFHVGAPLLFLDPDAERLARAGCRLRPAEHFRRARFVVRQTARYPIAALHDGLPFRNTLIAGFEHDAVSPALAVALLNSSLYRAIHLALRRDARQAVFPQVKVGHLRALPHPPPSAPTHRALERITRAAAAQGSGEGCRAELDRLVFELFELTSAERDAVRSFVASRSGSGRAPAH